MEEKRMCMTVSEMANELGISRSAAYELARSEGFTASFRVGTRLLISRHALEEWMEEQTRQHR